MKFTVNVPVFMLKVRVRVAKPDDQPSPAPGRASMQVKAETNFDETKTGDVELILSPGATPGIIAHECMHICQWLYHTGRMPILWDENATLGDEPAALVIQYLVDTIWSKLCQNSSE